MSGDTGGVRRPRPLTRAAVGPGPLRELKDLLYEVYSAADTPTLDDIAVAIAEDDELPGSPGRDTVRRCLSAPDVPPQQSDVVAVGRVLARRAAWDEEELASRLRGLWVRARMNAPIGQPINALTDPFALEVHRAIEIKPQDGRANLPILPTFVERAHDEELRHVVRRAAGGVSMMAVLVGGSSTGKTRSCWEAIHTLPEHWRLWHPIDPSRPEAALQELDAVVPYTVIWLNETQHYLLTSTASLGERLAARLRTLLQDSRRRPVLIIGTMWPEYWTSLTTAPSPTIPPLPDPHAQARQLLSGTHIAVPPVFNAMDLKALADHAYSDPRLKDALRGAEQGEITQYLAGAPALLERYRSAPVGARALIEAAMDARRFGHKVAIPHTLLEAAAEGYFTDIEWDNLSEDWFEQALAYCATPLYGARGPLTRIRPRRGEQALPQPHYRLADYLEQHGRNVRAGAQVPYSIAKALADQADRSKLLDFARGAEQLGLVSHSLTLYEAAFHDGHPDALRWAGVALEKVGRTQEAFNWYRRASETGDSAALGLCVIWLYDSGHSEDALAWLKRRVDEGDSSAAGWIAALLHRNGLIDEALSWYQRAAVNDENALRFAVIMLRDTGRSVTAATLEKTLRSEFRQRWEPGA